MVKTNLELVTALKKIAADYKTLYVMGCFGAPMTEKNKDRYCKNHSYNKQKTRTVMIRAASADTFGFDCVCLIKGVLWGWSGNRNANYGGAVYASNGVPDIGADGMIKKCKDVSADFSRIEVGEAVWKPGHIGVYIGDGLAVECTPSWANCVQVTAVQNIAAVPGYNARRWTSHGKLPYISYTDSGTGKPAAMPADTAPGADDAVTHIVKRGDTLYALAKKYGTTVDKIVSGNRDRYPNMTAGYIVVGWKLDIKR